MARPSMAKPKRESLTPIEMAVSKNVKDESESEDEEYEVEKIEKHRSVDVSCLSYNIEISLTR